VERKPIAGEVFLRALAEHGVDFFFANPGTDFPPIVEAFGRGVDDLGLVFSSCAHLFACVMPIAVHGDDAVRSASRNGFASGGAESSRLARIVRGSCPPDSAVNSQTQRFPTQSGHS